MSLIAKILSKFDDSGIRKAKSGFDGLKVGLAAFAGSAAFSALKQVGDIMIDASKAAMADKKSTELLNSQLTKNAHATKEQIKQNNKFIDTLSNQVGIVDDELRPAQAKLARATGSVTQSQKLLRLALDASAVSGKPLNNVADALSKAFVGNKSQLIRLFPALKESKNLFADLQKQVEGAALQQADPFSKLNVALDNMKEKLGYSVLPYVEDFIDKLIAPGGAVDAVNQFFDDVGNPKTDAGKAFKNFGMIVDRSVRQIKDAFAIFGKGDSLKGFENVLNILSQISTVLKNISDFINPLVIAINLIKDAQKNGFLPGGPEAPKPKISPQKQSPQIIVNVQGADPKATVNAISQYVKQNGGLPPAWNPYGTR